MGIAFIQDKLEIKFLILYIASRLTEPVDGADLQDMTMCDEGIDYFVMRSVWVTCEERASA